MAFDYRTEYQRYRQYYVNLRRFYQRPQVKVSFFVLLSFATVVFFSVFAIRPTVTTIGELIRSIEDKRRIDGQLEAKIRALDAVQTAIVSIENDLPLVDQAVPQTPEVGRLVQELEYVAQAQQVTLTAFTFKPVSLTQTSGGQKIETEKVEFGVTAGGSYENVQTFLRTMEQLGRVLTLTKVQLISGAAAFKEKGLPVLTEVEGEAYFLKKPIVIEETNDSEG